MESPVSTARIYTDFGGLARLKAEARTQSPEARREVARQFEALFIQMMLKSMRQAADAAGSQESEQTRFYRQMFDQQVALDLAENHSIGLASLFEKQLGGAAPAADGASALLPGRRPFPGRMAVTVPGSTEVEGEPVQGASWPPEDPAQFLRSLWPAARRVAERLGADPGVILAQAALESGWGRRTPRGEEGESYNLFGIKADARWQGRRVTVPTVEYRDGVAVRERAAFRAYDSPEQSLEDYGEFLRENPRYRRALEQAAHPRRFLRELQRAGYATDPAYAEKIGSILSSDVFATTLARLRAG